MMDAYLCLDLETTGTHVKKDRIIEIGAIKIEKGMEIQTFQTLVNPGRKLSKEVSKLTGITDEMLKEAPDIQDVLPGFLEFAEELPILGHQIIFDFAFLKKAAVNQKLTFERKGIDTLKIARKYLGSLPSRSLESLCTHYGITHQPHRAIEDVRATIKLYEKLIQDFEQEDLGQGGSLFIPRELHYQVKKDSPITKSQKEWLLKLMVQHKIETDYEIDKLTKSEASRYVDQILAEYGRSNF